MVLKLIFREKVTTHSSEQKGGKKKTFFRKCEESLTSQICTESIIAYNTRQKHTLKHL